MPAIKAGILELRKEIDEITLNNDLPSFENTIVALDLAGSQLSKVSSTFGNITGTDTNDTLRSLQGKVSPLLTREYNKIQFNEDLFARVKFVYESRDSLNLDEQDARLLELTHRGFVRAGANLSLENKARIAKINEELSSLTTEFGQNILASTVGFKMEITNPEHLSGLSESFSEH